MKSALPVFLLLLIFACRNQIGEKPVIITSDIDHFYNAFDSIKKVDDTLQQLNILQELFLDKASVGQLAMIEARNYTPQEYIKTMGDFPKFWESLRANTQEIPNYENQLSEGVLALRRIYPEMKPAKIYFTMGAHRSPGTGFDSLVLIGTEYALGDTLTDVSEFPEARQQYYKINPSDHLQLLNVHEFVHTQQKDMVFNLLSLVLYEGIAEYVAQQATGKSSPFDAFVYGKANNDMVRAAFEGDLYLSNTTYNWLWNSANNRFGTRDMGYYVGVQIASRYVDQSTNKSEAIKTLIELDYNDEEAVAEVVDASGYLSKPIDELYHDFEASRPTITSIKPFENESQDVDPKITEITLTFSQEMNPNSRGFDFGPLGEENVLRVQRIIGWSDDYKEFTFGIELKSDKRYQSLITNRFISKEGIPLKPFLIDFETR